jgi:hypothetical protein
MEAKMADGSRTSDIAQQAKAAAADAASDARADVLAKQSVAKNEALAKSPVADPAAPIKKNANASRSVSSKKAFHEFVVDVWITNFNSVEFGFYKNSRNKAKSRQFTSDMDIFAEITENGERTGLLGFREELWAKKTGMDKRLVFKLFNESLNWRATMDMMVGRSLQLTYGARGVPVVAYSINANDHEFMIYLERSANKWPFMPENFSFFILEEGKPAFYRLRRDFFDIGGDFTLFNEKNEKIGGIDGRLFTLGGHWKGRIKTEHADKRLVMVMQMFCGMLCYNRGAMKHMKQLTRDIAAGRVVPKLEKQEADLYMNPRRVR